LIAPLALPRKRDRLLPFISSLRLENSGFEQLPMTTLLIQTANTPLTLHLASPAKMCDEEFYKFCQANPELRIERSAIGDVIVMSPTFSDTGNRNFNLAVQLGVWAEQDGTGEAFDSSTGLRFPMGRFVLLMSPGLNAIAGMRSRTSKKPPSRPFVQILLWNSAPPATRSKGCRTKCRNI
jgi:Putative restriction endonuclease